MDSDGLSPLDVLLQAMQQRWGEGKVEEAVALAKAAAPYVHAKPAAGRGAEALSTMGDDRLDELCAAAIRGMGDADQRPWQPLSLGPIRAGTRIAGAGAAPSEDSVGP